MGKFSLKSEISSRELAGGEQPAQLGSPRTGITKRVRYNRRVGRGEGAETQIPAGARAARTSVSTSPQTVDPTEFGFELAEPKPLSPWQRGRLGEQAEAIESYKAAFEGLVHPSSGLRVRLPYSFGSIQDEWKRRGWEPPSYFELTAVILDEDGIQCGELTRWNDFVTAPGTDETSLYTKLSWLQVNHNVRGQGFGRAMHRYSIAVARAMGVDAITAWPIKDGRAIWASDPEWEFEENLTGFPHRASDGQARSDAAGLIRKGIQSESIDAAIARGELEAELVSELRAAADRARSEAVSQPLARPSEEVLEICELGGRLTPYHIWGLGREKTWTDPASEQESWLGREILLAPDNDWHGWRKP